MHGFLKTSKVLTVDIRRYCISHIYHEYINILVYLILIYTNIICNQVSKQISDSSLHLKLRNFVFGGIYFCTVMKACICSAYFLLSALVNFFCTD